MQQLGITGIQVNEVSLDSAYIKVHPDGMGALKKAPILSGERKADGKFHMLSASDRGGVILALCPWNCNDAPEGRAFFAAARFGWPPDRAYERDKAQALAVEPWLYTSHFSKKWSQKYLEQ